MKSTNDVLDHHLKAIEHGDVNAVLSDYAPDAVLFRSDGVFKGVAAIRPVFERSLQSAGLGRRSNTGCSVQIAALILWQERGRQ